MKHIISGFIFDKEAAEALALELRLKGVEVTIIEAEEDPVANVEKAMRVIAESK